MFTIRKTLDEVTSHMNQETLDLIQRAAENPGSLDADTSELVTRLQSDPSKVPEYQEILKNFEQMSEPVLVFAGQALLNISNIICTEVWTPDRAVELLTWNVDYIQRTLGSVPVSVLNLLASSISVLCVSYWRSDLVSRRLASLETFFSRDPSVWAPGFKIFQEFTSEMTKRVNERKLTADSVEVQVFGDKTLPVIFNIAFGVVKRFKAAEEEPYVQIADSALNLCCECMWFSKTPHLADFDWQSHSPTWPTPLAEIVLVPEVITRFFDIYGAGNHRTDALTCIAIINSVNPFLLPVETLKKMHSAAIGKKGRMFLDKHEMADTLMTRMFAATVNGLMPVISECVGFDNERNIVFVSTILMIITKPSRMKWKNMVEWETFGDFLGVVDSFTSNVMEYVSNSGDLHRELLENMIQVWTNLQSMMQDAGKHPMKEVVINLASEVTRKYVMLFLHMMTQSYELAMEILGDGESMSIVNELKTLICQENIVGIASGILEMYTESKTKLCECVSSGDRYGACTEATRLSLFVQVLIDLLKRKRVSQRDVESFKLHPAILGCLVELMENMKEWADLVDINMLECLILRFITQFSATIFASESTSKQLYCEFGMIDGGKFREKATLKAMKNALIERVISSLRYFKSGMVVDMAISAIKKMSANGYQVSKELLRDIISNMNGDSFPFMSIFENWKLRTKFYDLITQLIFKDVETNMDILIDFLNTFNSVIETLETPEAVFEISLVIRGIFSFVKKSEHYCTVFSWIKERMECLVNIINQPFFADPMITKALLKMWRAILQSDPLSSRIEFSPYCVDGLLLFKHGCAFISPCFAILSSQDLEDGHRWSIFKLVCQIVYYLAAASYVPYDAIMLYEDPVLMNLLASFVEVMKSMNIMDVLFQYTNIPPVLIRCINGLLSKHMDRLVSIDIGFVGFGFQIATLCAESGQSDLRDDAFSVGQTISKYLRRNPDAISHFSGSLVRFATYLWSLVFSEKTVDGVSEVLFDILSVDIGSVEFIKQKFIDLLPDKRETIEQYFLDLCLEDHVQHPYDSAFAEVLSFLRSKANDEKIKIVL